jgi:GT2 family glycosyltransferase
MKQPSVAVIIVGYRNPHDIHSCVTALSRIDVGPHFDVFVAENGGSKAMDELLTAIPACCCIPAPSSDLTTSSAVKQASFAFTTAGRARSLHIAQMPDNLGYAGAINVWVRSLLSSPQWSGFWILKPDTEPTPTALAELGEHSVRRGRGMVGSRITEMGRPEIVRTRGLAWRSLRAGTLAVDRDVPARNEPDPSEIERRLHAPCGASIYVTREVVRTIGLMDERYFLFFEDLEWGYRAKAIGALGYAHRSVVPHKGGSTTGSNGDSSQLSALSVYLDFRNCILFVRDKHPAWLPWTVLIRLVRAGLILWSGSAPNAKVALLGLLAGLRGETGRPLREIAQPGGPGSVALVSAHRPKTAASV